MMVRQILVVSALNIRGLRNRLWSSLVIVVGVACVVAVLISILSLTAGIVRSYVVSSRPGRVIVFATGAQSEGASRLTNEAVNFIMASPGIKKDENGASLADAEAVGSLPARKQGSGLNATLLVRGLGSSGMLLHSNLRIVAGRMFRPGTNEAIVGIGAQKQFTGLEVGSTVLMQNGPWPIVGTFRADGDLLEGQLIGDASEVVPAVGHKNYSTVIADLASPDGFDRFQQELSLNPALKVKVERQSDYFARTTERYSGFFNTVAFVLGGLMAIGAVFGTLNTLYSAVSTRSREIATLRALGFGATAVAASVILEAVFLSLVGAMIGAAVAWTLFNDQQKVLGSYVFSLSITLPLVGLGILWALTIALIGAALPSIRAARLPVAVALRAV